MISERQNLGQWMTKSAVTSKLFESYREAARRKNPLSKKDISILEAFLCVFNLEKVEHNLITKSQTKSIRKSCSFEEKRCGEMMCHEISEAAVTYYNNQLFH
ncbi:hypothetical protein D918_04339 [Trichuris suis]|nr:hypothetical protein D918_04339 [Trichuris suis]